MRDEYTLKIKLRDGAFNLAQALSSQASKVSKEKLIEARLEQRELLDDLCDIEDELETKLGVFKVHINGEGVCGVEGVCSRSIIKCVRGGMGVSSDGEGCVCACGGRGV